MKKFIIYIPIICLIVTACGNPRKKDIVDCGCKLVETFAKYKENPTDKGLSMDIIGLQSEFNSGIKNEGFSVTEIEEAMKESCGKNSGLLKEALEN